MKIAFKKLMQEQVQEMLDKFSAIKDTSPPGAGWLKVVRNALGITSSQQAKRLGMSQANVMRIEKSEVDGTVTLNTLSRVAQSMNCKVIYCVLPEKTIEEILSNRARDIAKKKVERINHSMRLEDQGLSEQELKQEEESLTKELLEGNLKELWNEDDY